MQAVLGVRANSDAVLRGLRAIVGQWPLVWELSKRELKNRYVGQWFGMAWAIGHPLFLIGLYAFIFGVVMRVRLEDRMAMPLDFTAYILVGVIPWMMSQEAMSRSCNSIVGNVSLVKQVVFPIEILPVTGVVVAAITQLIALACYFIYTIISGQSFFWSHLLLPIVFGFHVLLMVGIAFILASVAPFFRDLKDIVQIFCIAGLFLAPIIYLPDVIPRVFMPVIYINPFSYVIWVYRDILYYGRIEHPGSWVVLIVGSMVLFALGYRLFGRLRGQFGNAL